MIWPFITQDMKLVHMTAIDDKTARYVQNMRPSEIPVRIDDVWHIERATKASTHHARTYRGLTEYESPNLTYNTADLRF